MITHLHERPVRPARVVVLGTGFIGAELIRRFAEEGIATLDLSRTAVDLCDAGAAEALRRQVRTDDALVITSALTPDRGKDVGTLMKNLAMGATLCAFLQQAACAHVVYISSDAVYADTANPVHEGLPGDPGSLHGLMHLARERVLAHALAASKTPFLALRPCPVYGPGDPHNSYGPNRFLRTALADGTITLFGNGEEQRDHLYLSDLSRLIVQCVWHRSAGVLNAATGASVSFARVAELVAAACGGAVRISTTPRQSPLTHRFMRITACLNAFPAFRYTPLPEGLAETLGNTPPAPATVLSAEGR